MILSILNQKGGVGKTTLAVHVATAVARQGARVLLVDADPQGSALDWSAMRVSDPLFPVIGLPKAILHRELPKLAADYDHVVIDGPPRVYDVARSAIMASDFVVIPVQPSPYDVWAAKEIVDLLNEASTFKESLRSAFVINRKIVNTAIGRDVAEALAGYPVRVLNTASASGSPSPRAPAKAAPCSTLTPTARPSREVLALTREILEIAA